MNISDRGGKNMKSKIVRGIINGGVLAAVAALGITVYQFGINSGYIRAVRKYDLPEVGVLMPSMPTS